MDNEELHNLGSSPAIIRMIKSRSKRWAGNIARMGRSETYFLLLTMAFNLRASSS
jgi:hypothetical protein